jgi:hypothetical protein
MAERIPQSTTIRVPLQAYLASDHVSAATGKTIAITISKNGGAYGNPSAGATNATEIASGSYYVDLSTTDTATLGPLFVKGTEAATDTIIAIYNVVKATTGGYTALPDTAVTSNASLITSGSGTDQLTVTSGYANCDIKKLNNSATAATNMTTIFFTDYATLYNTTSKAFNSVLAAGAFNNTAIASDTGMKAISSGSGTLTAGSTTTATLPVGASSVDNFYRDLTLVVFSGTGAGQSAIIASYNGSTRVATFLEPIATALDSTSGVRIMPTANPTSTLINTQAMIFAK